MIRRAPGPRRTTRYEQAYFSAQQPSPGEGARVPRPDAHSRRTRYRDGSPRQGPQQALGLTHVLPRAHRITDSFDFRTTMRHGVRRGAGGIVVHTQRTEPRDPARFGLIVGKAVGGAVERNRVKRRLRALAATAIDEGLVGTDVVIRALPPARERAFAALDADLRRALDGPGRGGMTATADRADTPARSSGTTKTGRS